MKKSNAKKPKTICQLSAPNFRTMERASKAGHLCLLECRRRSDGKTVALICAMNFDKEGGSEMVPLAEMLQGDPFEQYDPPNPKGGFAP